MSKTDKTNPWWVKLHYDHSYLEPIHRHETHECNLPPRPGKHEDVFKWNGKNEDPCFWYPSFAYYRSRWAKCGCYMCSKYAYETPPSTKTRRESKRYCQDGWRDEY